MTLWRSSVCGLAFNRTNDCNWQLPKGRARLGVSAWCAANLMESYVCLAARGSVFFVPNKLRVTQIMARKEIKYEKMEIKEREQLQCEIYYLLLLLVRLETDWLLQPNSQSYRLYAILISFNMFTGNIWRSKKWSICTCSPYWDVSGLLVLTVMVIFCSYMEYCGGGDLSRLLKDLRKKGTSLREEVIWAIFIQLVSALYRCHYGVDPPEHPPNTRNQAPPANMRGNAVIHRDLKPENGKESKADLEWLLTAWDKHFAN